ncbi:MAG: hypothetical protein U0527_02085 [Candidatus Eisenbacteria bacterium]
MTARAQSKRAGQAGARLPRPLALSLRGEALLHETRARIVDSGLPTRIGHGVVLASFLAAGRIEQFGEQLEAALSDSASVAWLGESILQSYLFVGFPRAWQGLKCLREARARRGDKEHLMLEVPDLKALIAAQHSESGHPAHDQLEEWWARGESLCREIYGPQYDRLRVNLGGYHPELADWMILEGYGKVLSRPTIAAGEREQWIVPILVVQEARDQMHSHLRGALRVGVSAEAMRAVVRLSGATATRRGVTEGLALLDALSAVD